MTELKIQNESQRVEVVDALRGLALFAILIANIPFNESLSTPAGIVGSAKSDSVLTFLFHLLVDKKFITIFSTLFGFGFYMQMKNLEKKFLNFRIYFAKRMLLLLVIGCIHAYFIWFGDIIRDYAICGLLLLLVYRLNEKRLLQLSLFFILFVTPALFIVNSVFEVQTYSYDYSIAKTLPMVNSYIEYLKVNFIIDPFVNFIQDSPITLSFAFGNILMGFWMAKKGFFENFQQFKKARLIIIFIGAFAGLTASYFFLAVTSGKINLNLSLIWLPFVLVAGMVMQSHFYISSFVQLFQKKHFKSILCLFSPIGKMALSNYILQSVFYCFVFFHFTHGLCLYNKISVTETYLVAVLLFGIQFLFSYLWLKKFRQGPVEFIWKKMVYLKAM